MKAVWLYTSWTSCAILEQWNGPIKTIMIQTVCDCPGQGSGSGRGHCDFEVAVPVRVKEEPAVGFDHTKKEKKNMGVCLFFQTPK